MKKNLFIGVSLTVGIPTTTMAQQKQPEHPNLIFIITDQLRNDRYWESWLSHLPGSQIRHFSTDR